MPARKNSSVDREIDRLFQLSLQEFTAARNSLVANLKRAGELEEAARVAGLAKPPLSAWVVNQLFWRHGPDFAHLRQVGDRFREAQRAQLTGARVDLRSALDERRETLSALMSHGPDLLRESGHAATPDVMRRVSTTLDALATYGTLPEAPPAGRLMQDLKPLGFETLAALVPRPGENRRGGETPKVLPFAPVVEKRSRPAGRGTKHEREAEREAELRAKRAAAKKAIEDTTSALREARRAAQAVEAALKQAAARAKTAQKAKEALEKRFEQATAAAETASKEAHRVAREAEDAAQAVNDAERDLERAKNVLRDLPQPS
jgi:hypothetical protein